MVRSLAQTMNLNLEVTLDPCLTFKKDVSILFKTTKFHLK